MVYTENGGLEPLTEEERAKQREYWAEHSKKGSSMENMMLDRSARKLDLLDRPEVLSLLPPFAGRRVLELASGIGRFTGSIAAEAESVVTVEFMEEFLNKNRELHQSLGNVEFICSDVLALDLAPRSFDLVFSCWIHMYLNDSEVRALTQKSLEWLKPGGNIFLRESCFRQSGDVSRAFNPSHYRHPSFYTNTFAEVSVEEADGSFWGLELVRTRNLEAYVEVKGNKGQICWLLRKVPKARPNGHPPATCAPLAMHEALFGEGHSSRRIGGDAALRALTRAVGAKAGERVLEVGCGLGGVAVAMAQEGAKVWGNDDCAPATDLAIQRSMAFPSAHIVLETSARTGASGTFDAALVHEPPVSAAAAGGGAGVADDVILSDAAARLRPGGRMVVSALIKPGAEDGVRDTLARLVGESRGAVDVSDHSAELVESLSRDLEALKTRAKAGTEEEDAQAGAAWTSVLGGLRNGSLCWLLLTVVSGKGAAATNGHAHKSCE